MFAPPPHSPAVPVRDELRAARPELEEEALSNALATVCSNRHTPEGAVSEFDEYMKLHREKPKFNSVSSQPTATQCLLAYTIDECASLIETNISNRAAGVGRDVRLLTTQTGPMMRDVQLVASACELLHAANIDLPVRRVGMGFQKIALDLDFAKPDVHSYQQTRDQAVDFWWNPTGYVWMYGSHSHTEQTVADMLRALNQEEAKREFKNHKGQTERVIHSSPYASGAYIIYELEPLTLLEAIRQVPPPPSTVGFQRMAAPPKLSVLREELRQTPSEDDGDLRRRDVIRYAYNTDTLVQLDRLRALEPLIYRIWQGDTVFTAEESVAIARFNIQHRYRAVSIDGPPRTVPYGAYVVQQFSGIDFNKDTVEQLCASHGAAIHATVRRTNAGRDAPVPVDSMTPEKQKRYESIIALTHPGFAKGGSQAQPRRTMRQGPDVGAAASASAAAGGYEHPSGRPHAAASQGPEAQVHQRQRESRPWRDVQRQQQGASQTLPFY